MHAGGSDFRALLHDLESRLLAPSWRGALLVKEAIRRAQTPLRSTGEGVVKASSASTPLSSGLIPVSGRSPGEGNGNPLQYPCLEAGRLSGTVSPFRAEQGTSLETPSRARASSCQEVGTTWFFTLGSSLRSLVNFYCTRST